MRIVPSIFLKSGSHIRFYKFFCDLPDPRWDYRSFALVIRERERERERERIRNEYWNEEIKGMILKKMALYELFYRTLGNNKKEYKIASFIEKKKLIIRYGKR